MAVIVGITGGIGSGKTTLMDHISRLGYKTYDTDLAGKEVLKKEEVVKEVEKVFWPSEVTTNGAIDRKKLAAIVFNDKKKLEQLNKIVHPAVAEDFKKFIENLGKEELIFKESAILFESGAYKNCDVTILITAPVEVRTERVMKRDGVSREEVKERIAHQMSDEKKSKLSDYIIENIHLDTSFKSIEAIISKILRK